MGIATPYIASVEVQYHNYQTHIHTQKRLIIRSNIHNGFDINSVEVNANSKKRSSINYDSN